jgi:hypothetical protein
MGNKAGKRNTRRSGGGRRRSQILDGGAPKQSFAKKKRRNAPSVEVGIVVPTEPIISDDIKPERNAPCPCGSGVKQKVCCGRAEAVPETTTPREDSQHTT